jgi:hypothetical protein
MARGDFPIAPICPLLSCLIMGWQGSMRLPVAGWSARYFTALAGCTAVVLAKATDRAAGGPGYRVNRFSPNRCQSLIPGSDPTHFTGESVEVSILWSRLEGRIIMIEQIGALGYSAMRGERRSART